MRTSCVYFLLLWISGTLMFEQNDYNITFERMQQGRHNEQYVTKFKVVNYKYNRTCAVMNATFTYLVDLGNKIEVIAQVYKFMSNEYRLFPIHFQFNFCDATENNDFGLGKFYACGNFTRCPVKKGKYHICNWAPESSKFPPYIPNGIYKVELQVMHKNADVMVLEAFGSVSRTIPWI